jgi:hypothetical protein
VPSAPKTSRPMPTALRGAVLVAFPVLDAYSAAKGYQFYPLDLRWGVNEEAQLDQRTAEICVPKCAPLGATRRPTSSS